MNATNLLILQFAAHLLSDYIFQNDRWAKDKIEKGFESKYLLWHGLITFIISWILSAQLLFVSASFAIAVLHYVIDGFKKNIAHKTEKYSFFIDQLVHILVILGIVLLYNYIFQIQPIALPLNSHWLLIITGYILCAKPSNIFIKEVFKTYGININTGDETLNAGRLIGILERIIALTLVLCNQFEAVGFIIAAKSIIRYKEADTSKTEYVLIGTLLSFGIAIMVGITILKLHL